MRRETPADANYVPLGRSQWTKRVYAAPQEHIRTSAILFAMNVIRERMLQQALLAAVTAPQELIKTNQGQLYVSLVAIILTRTLALPDAVCLDGPGILTSGMI